MNLAARRHNSACALALHKISARCCAELEFASTYLVMTAGAAVRPDAGTIMGAHNSHIVHLHCLNMRVMVQVLILELLLETWTWLHVESHL